MKYLLNNITTPPLFRAAQGLFGVSDSTTRIFWPRLLLWSVGLPNSILDRFASGGLSRSHLKSLVHSFNQLYVQWAELSVLIFSSLSPFRLLPHLVLQDYFFPPLAWTSPVSTEQLLSSHCFSLFVKNFSILLRFENPRFGACSSSFSCLAAVVTGTWLVRPCFASPSSLFYDTGNEPSERHKAPLSSVHCWMGTTAKSRPILRRPIKRRPAKRWLG